MGNLLWFFTRQEGLSPCQNTLQHSNLLILEEAGSLTCAESSNALVTAPPDKELTPWDTCFPQADAHLHSASFSLQLPPSDMFGSTQNAAFPGVELSAEREIQLRLRFGQIFHLTTDLSSGLRSLGVSGEIQKAPCRPLLLWTHHRFLQCCGQTAGGPWRALHPYLLQPPTSPWLITFFHHCFSEPTCRKLLLSFTGPSSQQPLWFFGSSPTAFAGFREGQFEPQSGESHFWAATSTC